ncbi:hypothetical protein VIGAN_01097500 [Vigna angularis var. angularis]|uniref:GAG-pre-integrase domain-containing protein n=1 Tax=Vigna angularis var. angularis TaxID=157739 RepID=A0A0S3QYQ1_PHAAN|nr:hypothetical protein VIGAN_01097500 [Vigna angularis var. angularis]
MFLYVPKINQNLLSVGQLLEKGFKVIFEDKVCTIKDPTGLEMFKVKMRSKSFSFNPMKEEHIAFPITASSVNLWHKRLGSSPSFGNELHAEKSISLWSSFHDRETS